MSELVGLFDTPSVSHFQTSADWFRFRDRLAGNEGCVIHQYDPPVHTVWEPKGRYRGELCEQGNRSLLPGGHGRNKGSETWLSQMHSS